VSVLVVCRFLWLFDLPFLVANDQKLNEIVIFKWNMSFLTTQEKRESLSRLRASTCQFCCGLLALIRGIICRWVDLFDTAASLPYFILFLMLSFFIFFCQQKSLHLNLHFHIHSRFIWKLKNFQAIKFYHAHCQDARKVVSDSHVSTFRCRLYGNDNEMLRDRKQLKYLLKLHLHICVLAFFGTGGMG